MAGATSSSIAVGCGVGAGGTTGEEYPWREARDRELKPPRPGRLAVFDTSGGVGAGLSPAFDCAFARPGRMGERRGACVSICIRELTRIVHAFPCVICSEAPEKPALHNDTKSPRAHGT